MGFCSVWPKDPGETCQPTYPAFLVGHVLGSSFSWGGDEGTELMKGWSEAKQVSTES